MFLGCESVPTKPVDSSEEAFIFLEYGICTEGEFKEGSLKFHIDAYGGIYSFDEENYSIIIDPRMITPDNVKIDESDKFIFGKYENINYGDPDGRLACGDLSESLITQKSFYKVDTLTSRFSEKCYEIKMVGCSSSGEAKLLLNNKEITIRPQEIFVDNFTYPDVTFTFPWGTTYYFNSLKDIVIIKNMGFIKKTAIVYENYL
jgi:hypothetical protein